MDPTLNAALKESNCKSLQKIQLNVVVYLNARKKIRKFALFFFFQLAYTCSSPTFSFLVLM